MRIPFGTGAYKLGTSVTFAAQSMVNGYLEQAPPGSEVPFYVRGAHGIAAWETIGNGPIRGAAFVRSTYYVVSGTRAYRVGMAGDATELGTVPGANRVTVVGDETNVVFLADRVMYRWNGSAFSTVTDADAPRTDWLAVIDGYYLGSDAETGVFKISANRDPSTWAALDFASAEKYPDDVVTGIVDHGEAVIFGTASGEVYYNSGNADFPLEKVPSGHFEVGALSVHGPAKLDNTIFFPGSDHVVYRLSGYQPERISTHSIESEIARAADKDFVGFAWTEDGHKFYALSSSSITLVYDVASQMWHQRKSHGYSSWKVATVTHAYGTVLVGDARSGKVGELSPDVFAEWDDPLRLESTCPPVSDENKESTHDRLELIFETGRGDAVAPDPQVMLQFSDDRGRTWSNEKWRSLGAVGEYGTRVVYRLLGRSRSRIYRYAISDAVPRALIGATVELESGDY